MGLTNKELMKKSKKELCDIIRATNATIHKLKNLNSNKTSSLRSYKHHMKKIAKRMNWLAEHTYSTTLEMEGGFKPIKTKKKRIQC